MLEAYKEIDSIVKLRDHQQQLVNDYTKVLLSGKHTYAQALQTFISQGNRYLNLEQPNNYLIYSEKLLLFKTKVNPLWRQ